MVFSGFWLAVVRRIRLAWQSEPPTVDICHVVAPSHRRSDASCSPTPVPGTRPGSVITTAPKILDLPDTAWINQPADNSGQQTDAESA
ncbi:MAG TPA: hypothetical protein VG756_26530 [Pseudonocardiaceae bacterium]|nr:hypothetical protein [Pseudonocardiaceae bacterium]